MPRIEVFYSCIYRASIVQLIEKWIMSGKVKNGLSLRDCFGLVCLGSWKRWRLELVDGCVCMSLDRKLVEPRLKRSKVFSSAASGDLRAFLSLGDKPVWLKVVFFSVNWVATLHSCCYPVPILSSIWGLSLWILGMRRTGPVRSIRYLIPNEREVHLVSGVVPSGVIDVTSYNRCNTSKVTLLPEKLTVIFLVTGYHFCLNDA